MPAKRQRAFMEGSRSSKLASVTPCSGGAKGCKRSQSLQAVCGCGSGCVHVRVFTYMSLALHCCCHLKA
eukprot:1027838-Pelagomonas_calceolata.AAC.2